MLQYVENLSNRNFERPFQVILVELKRLREHEEVDLLHLRKLKEEIKSDKILKFAITVDKDTNIILDGHHRFNALREFGCREIPVVFVDYKTSQIRVKSWRKHYRVTKGMVIEAGFGGRKFPPKTSKHMILDNGKLKHIFAIEKEVDFPLKELT